MSDEQRKINIKIIAKKKNIFLLLYNLKINIINILLFAEILLRQIKQ